MDKVSDLLIDIDERFKSLHPTVREIAGNNELMARESAALLMESFADWPPEFKGPLQNLLAITFPREVISAQFDIYRCASMQFIESEKIARMAVNLEEEVGGLLRGLAPGGKVN